MNSEPKRLGNALSWGARMECEADFILLYLGVFR